MAAGLSETGLIILSDCCSARPRPAATVTGATNPRSLSLVVIGYLRCASRGGPGASSCMQNDGPARRWPRTLLLVHGKNQWTCRCSACNSYPPMTGSINERGTAMSNNGAPLTRRHFLGAAAGMTLMSAARAGAWSRVKGANDRVRLALVGCGTRGTQASNFFLRHPDVESVAATDVFKTRLDERVATF